MEIMVSIIIPVYNSQQYLRETLDSILCQTYRNFEVIAVNDGSIDNSTNILVEYALKDSRIHVLEKENSGVSDTRNRGIELATGKYLCFVDSDDLISPRFVEKMVEAALDTSADMVVCDYIPFRRTRECFEYKEKSEPTLVKNVYELLSSGLMTSACTKMISSRLIKEHRIDFCSAMTFGEDLFFCWKVYQVALKVCMVHQKLYGYRMTGQGATSRFHPNLYQKYKVSFEELKEFCRRYDCFSSQDEQAMDIYFTKRISSFLLMIGREKTGLIHKRTKIKNILRDDIIQRILKEEWQTLIKNETKKNIKLYYYAKQGNINGLLLGGYIMNSRNKLSGLKNSLMNINLQISR